MASELAVWLLGQRVGTLSWTKGQLAFGYRAEWLTAPDSVALSQSLPLRREPFGERECRPFFAGLLPEGTLRRLIAQRYQVSQQNDFALLNAIGGECAGAVTFLPVGQSVTPDAALETEWLNETELANLLDELPQRPMLAGRDGIRLSLAGAQDKLPVVFDGRRVGLPKGGQPSTHILKPAIASVENSVWNEGYCLALSKTLGLATAASHILQVADRHVLLVERYDRRFNDDAPAARIHQEDFCQALGVAPELKYQNEGGPGFQACFELLRRATRPSAPQVLRLLDAVIFNTLIGNHDAHAKNFSLLYTIQGPVLAPLYDVLSTAVYAQLTPKMAMKLGSKYRFDEIQPRHWEQFATATGLSGAQTKKRVLRMAQQLPSIAREVQMFPQFAGQPIVDRIVALIDERSRLTAQRATVE
jgi:serine/threonine-protein kinase HipA